jgi:hypothetical protein
MCFPKFFSLHSEKIQKTHSEAFFQGKKNSKNTFQNIYSMIKMKTQVGREKFNNINMIGPSQ